MSHLTPFLKSNLSIIRTIFVAFLSQNKSKEKVSSRYIYRKQNLTLIDKGTIKRFKRSVSSQFQSSLKVNKLPDSIDKRFVLLLKQSLNLWTIILQLVYIFYIYINRTFRSCQTAWKCYIITEGKSAEIYSIKDVWLWHGSRLDAA